MSVSIIDVLGAERRERGGLGDVRFVVRVRAGSVSPYIRKHSVRRIHIDRAGLMARARARKAAIERRLRTLSVTMRPSGALGSLGGVREDLLAAQEEAGRAQADLLVLGGDPTADLDELATQAAYKAWGETEARLGLPLSYGSFLVNAGYQRLRATDDKGRFPSRMGNWIGRAVPLDRFAGEFLSEAEFTVNNYLGGNMGQILNMGDRIQTGLRSAGRDMIDLASGFAGSVEAGGLSIVQDAMALRPDWMTNDLVGQVGGAITRAVAAGEAGDLGAIVAAIGGGVMTIGAATGPAAPFVMAAGGLMMLGGLVADLFATADAPPPRPEARIASEHWGAFKLLYAASVDGSAENSIERVSLDELDRLVGDPNTGETMVRPRPRWNAGGAIPSSPWQHAVRMVDLFDRRSLVESDRVRDWIRTGRGITFDGRQDSPATQWADVLANDPFVKFAGAMDSSPVPNPTGGSAGWPVGPYPRWEDGYWSTPVYRAAYVAAAALGGCPPFASYGFLTDYVLADNYYACGGVHHCTGVGGRIDTDTGIPGRTSMRWIPWSSYYHPADGHRLIPPRRVPHHLQGLSNTNGEFRSWLLTGAIVGRNVNFAMDPELIGAVRSGAPGEPTVVGGPNPEALRTGMAGHPLDRAMTLEEFFRDWYDRPYREDEPRTWFIRGTPRPTMGMMPIMARQAAVGSRSQRAQQRVRQEAEAKKWSTGTKVAVGGGIVVAGGTGLYFLGQALGWWK